MPVVGLFWVHSLFVRIFHHNFNFIYILTINYLFRMSHPSPEWNGRTCHTDNVTESRWHSTFFLLTFYIIEMELNLSKLSPELT